MKNVYLVTQGEYSNYHIEGIFSTKKKADTFCKTLREIGTRYDRPQVETYPLDDQVGAKSTPFWSVTIRLDTGAMWDKPWESICVTTHPDHQQGFKYGYGGNRWVTGTSYKSEDHAMKLAVEGRQAWLRNEAQRS